LEEGKGVSIVAGFDELGDALVPHFVGYVMEFFGEHDQL
jgi:hypothetical protein